jgi:hypothetical protein
MPRDDRFVQMQLIKDSQDIFSEPAGGIARRIGSGVLEAPRPRRLMP